MTGFWKIFAKRYGTVLLFLLLFLFPCQLRSQETIPDSLLIFRFVKPEVELAEPGSYFNVLEIVNNRQEPLTFLVRVDCPDSWHFIGPPADTITLEPGSTRLYPVRISIPGNTIGGISYVIGAELFSEELYDYANAYISIKRKSRWDMRLSTTQVYFSDFMPFGEISVSLKNTGNAHELVKLSLDLGGMLEFRDEIEADSFIYVSVPAYRDTSILLRIQRNRDLTYAESKALMNTWTARSLNIKASTADHVATGSVRATPLESRRINRLPLLNTPLNAELTFYNLLSQQKKKASARVFGTVLFPEEQQLTYSLGYYNFYFDQDLNRDVDLYQQLRYMVRYSDQNTMIWLGDRLGVGNLHTLSGRGIRASHDINERNRVMLNVVQNPYGRNIGGFAGYGGVLGDVGWNTGVTLETTTNQLYSHYSFHLGGNYQLLQKHTFNIQTATSLSKYSDSRYLDGDTTVVGLAYQFFYRYNNNRLRINLENTNTLFTYLRNSGINRINFNASYKFRDDYQLKVRYYRSAYSSTRYPYNFEFPANTNISENARVLLSYFAGKVIYQGGPRYRGIVRNTYNPVGDYRTKYVNYQPGLIGSVSFRMKNRRSITPNASFNLMYYNYDRLDAGSEGQGLDSRWTYTLGINYYDQAFKFTAYYSSGESTDIYRTAVIRDVPEINQSFHVRPYYERFFLKDQLRLSTYLTYSYYMPSLRNNILFNLTGDVYVNQSWNFFTSLNMYRVSRRDLYQGRMTNSSLNLFVGVRKAFNIQQPRLGYYDLTIIGFNDLDGDGIKDDEEMPISNMLVHISRDPQKNVEKKTGFAETSMITDPRGEIYYENIPEGIYDLAILPLSNLENLYFLNGDQQTIEINDDLVHFLPLVESYKIRGRIIIDRDPYSTEGRVSPEGIRISAVSETGETYSTLSSSFGTYVLDLPKASSYEVNIYNVFGENYRLERGTYKVQFTENRTINLDFKFTEQRRGIRFNEGEQFFQFDLGNGNQEGP